MINKILTKLKEYDYTKLNIKLVLFVCALTIIGTRVIGSATQSEQYAKRQTIAFLVSLVIMAIVAIIHYKLILKFYFIYYIINIGLLLGVKFFGASRGGAQRWIQLPGNMLQPSEFTKIFLVLFFAYLIAKYKDKLNTFKNLFAYAILLALPVYLILDQPDLSTSIVIIMTICAMIYIAGLHYKIIAGILVLITLVSVVFAYLVMQPDQTILQSYQLKRIIAFYDDSNEELDDLRVQQENSVLAIGSGGINGKGLNNNTTTSVKNGNYLSEPHTDFIFTIVGEELGFVGGMAVIVLLFLIVFECFRTGSRSPEMSGKLVCCGMGSLIGFQAFINIAVVTMIIPNTGLTLPFVSYGINSLITLFAGLGVVLNISMQQKKAYYEEEGLF